MQTDAGPTCNPTGLAMGGGPPSSSSPLSASLTNSQATKRLRTTITPEQLHFLYDCYQQESNPSRKMLEQIAKQVNLKKRVVQVWYQNSRARERKGQYRTSSNIMSSAGAMMMDNFVGSANATSNGGGGGNGDGLIKSPKLGGDTTTTMSTSSSAADLGFLFNSFKQHY